MATTKAARPKYKTQMSKMIKNDTPPLLLSGQKGYNLSHNEVEALQFLLPLSEDYPGIKKWYQCKVVPGVRAGTRTLLRVERDGKLVGVGIAKNEHGERKICTVRVAPEYFGRGIGIRLFDQLMEWLNDEKPHLTVGEAKLPLFDKIFDRYGFDLTSKQQGLYLPHVAELGFNDGKLTLPNLSASGNKSQARYRS